MGFFVLLISQIFIKYYKRIREAWNIYTEKKFSLFLDTLPSLDRQIMHYQILRDGKNTFTFTKRLSASAHAQRNHRRMTVTSGKKLDPRTKASSLEGVEPATLQGPQNRHWQKFSRAKWGLASSLWMVIPLPPSSRFSASNSTSRSGH